MMSDDFEVLRMRSFINSSNKCSLNTFSGPDTLLGARDVARCRGHVREGKSLLLPTSSWEEI